MNLTLHQLNRATLARQLLLRREDLSVVEAVRRLVGLQAQEPASPYLALWNRVKSFDAAEFDRVLAQGQVYKSTLMRITLHNVAAEDYPTFYAAMQASLRASRVHDKRFAPAGLPLEAVDPLLQELCGFLSQDRTEAEIVEWLAGKANPVPIPGDPKVAWWALKTFGPWTRVPGEGPWAYPGDRYSLAPVFTEAKVSEVPFEASVQSLLLRYLAAYGPSSAQDFARFTLLRSPVVSAALKASADRLVQLQGPEGEALYDLAGVELPEPDASAPARLLPLFDNLLLGHVHSSRVLPPAYRPRVSRVNGDLLPTVLVDGWVAGVWRVFGEGLEVTAFRKFTDDEWEAVANEAVALRKFLATREPRVFVRSHHWWDKNLPGEQTRIFAD